MAENPVKAWMAKRRGAAEAAAAEQRDRDERLSERLAGQWAEIRAANRREEPPEVIGGQSNFSRAQVPWAFDLAAAWSWRLIIIAAAVLGALWLLSFFAVIVLPLIVALLVAALTLPIVQRLQRWKVPRGLAALLVVVFGLGSVILLLTFVGQQVASGMNNLTAKVIEAIDKIRIWLAEGPLHVSDKDLQSALAKAQESLTGLAGKSVLDTLTTFGTTIGHVFAGIFIVLFATYFFLADGPMIWSWVVRLFPRAARLRADSSGKVAWQSLVQFVRATVMVAGSDALGIALGAWILGVPFPLAIGVLVFFGAFVPMIGATVSGTVAVLVALVSLGPFKALLMLGVVILVQQLEAHVLQPFLLGRFVSVHPLAVIIAIGCGVLVAGVAGALIAVPFVASLNAVVQHLAEYTEVGESPVEAAERDPLTPDPAD